MAALKKIIKNTTGSDIILLEVGLTIEAGDNYQIPDDEFVTHWAREETRAEINSFITSGDIVVNDGTIDLSAVDGIRFLEYADRIDVQQNGTNVVRVNKGINFTGNVAVTDSGDGKATVNIPQDNMVGAMDIIDFSIRYGANNKFLKHEDNNSNESPAVVMFKSKLRGLVFSNKKDNVNCDIEFHVAAEGAGIISTVVFIWQIRNCRTACLSTFNPDILFDTCDKIAVFVKYVSGANSPGDVTVRMGLQITNNDFLDLCEDYTGDISTGGGGTSSS